VDTEVLVAYASKYDATREIAEEIGKVRPAPGLRLGTRGRHSQGYRYPHSVDGWVLLIGVGIDRCSSMHLAEQVPVPDQIQAYWRAPEDL
jgi:hypothetical protein